MSEQRIALNLNRGLKEGVKMEPNTLGLPNGRQAGGGGKLEVRSGHFHDLAWQDKIIDG